MKIDMYEIPVKDLFEGYKDSQENGVVAYNGKLNVRPPFQREFVYSGKQRDEVIRTITKGFPLNVMYWIKSDSGYELLDGQQRTISICQYLNNDYSIDYRFFHNLTKTEQDALLDYKLMIYICDGTDLEKIEWFKIINIAGEKLTDQEMRNALYNGTWVTEAKRYFSKTGCPATQIASDYLSGKAIRQEYLEKVLFWIANREGIEIKDYMAKHQHDTNCNELWLYFQSVINWVKVIFPNYRSDMKGIEWGILYNKYKDNSYDPATLEKRIEELIDDDEVQKNKGIYEFLLGGETEQKLLSLRQFPDKMARRIYQYQQGICPMCGSSKTYKFEEMEADHIIPWSQGGKTEESNCQMLCKHHNRTKSDS